VYGSKIGSYIPLRISLPDEQVNNVIAKVKELASTHAAIIPSFAGSYFRNKQLIREMLIVLVISIVLLFFILAAQFESLGLPFIVLIEIPIDIAGGLLILYLAGSSLNVMSLIGFVVMGGIIINDSILKIDTIKQLRKSGMPPLEAVLEGGRRRLKPILMTSLTTIIAIIPQIFGSGVGAQLQQPLSFTILGGMSIGTFVSLFMVPLLYLYFAKK
jgi:multidrug efflux pump subunit AcrB